MFDATYSSSPSEQHKAWPSLGGNTLFCIMEGVQKIVIRGGGGANFSAVFSQMSANNPAEMEDCNLENYDEMFILHKFLCQQKCHVYFS